MDATTDTAPTQSAVATIPRWRMHVTYLDGRRPAAFEFEELEEVDGLIEHGPNFYTIDRITITPARYADGELREAPSTDAAPVEAINRILGYLEHDERRHFEECTKKERRNHIYNAVRDLRAWYGKHENRTA